MMRVILLTFGFMGWALFEASGGSAFEPGENGLATMARIKAPVVAEEPLPTPEPTVLTRADTTSEPLTRVSSPRIIVKPAPELVAVADDKLQDVAGLAAALDTVDAADGVVLGGLGGDLSNFGRPVGQALPEVPATMVTTVAATTVDYRVVTGSRVNLRAGPGTDYGVVTRLVRGNEVEILDDAGNGWVKLRALNGQDIGWMSDAFLVASN